MRGNKGYIRECELLSDPDDSYNDMIFVQSVSKNAIRCEAVVCDVWTTWDKYEGTIEVQVPAALIGRRVKVIIYEEE